MQLVVETERLVLKVLHENEAIKVLRFYEENDDYFKPYEPARTQNFYTIGFQQTSLRYEYNQMIKSKSLRYYIFEKNKPNEIIGTICFSNIIKGAFSSCQIGYKLDHNYFRKGYATESIEKCLSILFKDYGLHRIEAYIMPTNLPSLRLIEKLGFTYEGTCISYANIDGKWEDHKRYALINNT